ncbi:hypothetical protein [Desulfurobacterium indicum]|uniref:Uncharacterized protein n=1 Tax=Desulfurobacterium indicum TaxID=1914305 RepID=A0A1R1MK93_9BACT|nr:hypothetical protein [Desulfurobacterium indicum]OMH40183.1 hypothetical protein BLW93_06680 [Desulfurobacterium indicum]
MTVDTVVGWFLAVCIAAAATAFIAAVVFIAASPLIAVIYLIADWYERRSSHDTLSDSQEETEAALIECSKIHYS